MLGLQTKHGKMEAVELGATNALPDLTKSTLVEVNMANQSLPFSRSRHQSLPCPILGCDRNQHTTGLCKFHYDRKYRGRDLYAPINKPPTGCVTENCTDKHYSRGFCRKHYDQSVYRKKPRPTVAERFWKAVDKNGPTMPHMETPCWLFTSKSENNGYGIFGIGKRNHVAHRVSWFLMHGEWPTFLLHECDVRRCVNPQHLSEGNHQLNADDRGARNRQAKGSKHGRARLTEQDIPIIDEMHWKQGMSCQSIAHHFNVSRGTVTHVVYRYNWKHIPCTFEIKRKPTDRGLSGMPRSSAGVN
jgi:hypothetical protein